MNKVPIKVLLDETMRPFMPFITTSAVQLQDGEHSLEDLETAVANSIITGSYDNLNKKIILTAQNGHTVKFSIADIIYGLQSEITSQNKLSSDLVDDANQTNKFVTPSEKTTWNGKQDTLVSGTNIKTINGNSILGSGDITISGGQVTSVNGQIGDVVIDIPDVSNFITRSVDDLVNYYKKSETYTQSEVNNLIGAIQQFHYEIVQTLPATGATNILYLVPKSESQTTNYYDEYVYANNNWEKIGDTEIDLSNYVTVTQLNTALSNYTTTAQLTTLLNAKQDTIQYETMPTASADNVGDIVQYVGATTNDYINGAFYKCVYDYYEKKLVVPQGAYFELNYLPTVNTEIEVSFKSVNYVSDAAIFGCQIYNYYPNIHWSGSNFYIGTGQNEQNISGQFQNDKKYVINWNTKNASNNDGYIKINDKYFGSYSFNYTGNQQIKLFSYYGNQRFDGEFYYLKTIDKTTNEVTHNWIPASNNGTACIYDTITDTYIYNSGEVDCTYVDEFNDYYWTATKVEDENAYYLHLITDFTDTNGSYRYIYDEDETAIKNAYNWLIANNGGNLYVYAKNWYGYTILQNIVEFPTAPTTSFYFSFVNTDSNIKNALYTRYIQVSLLNGSLARYTCFQAYIYGRYQSGVTGTLLTNNSTAYTPTSNYHPATKKYVDDSISSAVGNISTALANLVTVEESE